MKTCLSFLNSAFYGLNGTYYTNKSLCSNSSSSLNVDAYDFNYHILKYDIKAYGYITERENITLNYNCTPANNVTTTTTTTPKSSGYIIKTSFLSILVTLVSIMLF